ncbi:MAG: NADP-dependent phosphogluconate dehydrogenase [Syntrophobacteraceae bacterium]|jgi:6-phosphogluconate dehydrogenase
MTDKKCDIAVAGVGVMGGNLALNMAGHGFSVAVYDPDAEKARALAQGKEGGGKIHAGGTVQELVAMLHRPRAVLLLVPAGKPVDDAISTLTPHFDKSDLIIDGGNSHFTDTNRREKLMAQSGMLFMGMGISGGEYGARRGPSIMPGGPSDAYERVRKILEASAAHVNGDPCVAHMGAGSAGHYVKMVHNGIEYGVMQLISETYDIMKRGMGMSPGELAEIYSKWNGEELNSYLIEITADIFHYKDEKDPKLVLIDLILDRARQKGTGKWTSWDAMELEVPTPNVDAAVIMRNLSGYPDERKKASEVLHGPEHRFKGDRAGMIGHLRNACYAGMVMTYAQGFALLKAASRSYEYGLDLETVARIWRGGCIIRAAVLEPIRTAFSRQSDLSNLLMDEHFSREINARQKSLRTVVATAAELGVPSPGFSASLAYLDAYRSAWLPANLIQAQRDYFGAHTYERKDMPGKFLHTDWRPPAPASSRGA